jgi:hypothetical protein
MLGLDGGVDGPFFSGLVSIGHRPAHDEQKRPGQGIGHPARIARIVDAGATIEERGRGFSSKTTKERLMTAAPQSNRPVESRILQSVNSLQLEFGTLAAD